MLGRPSIPAGEAECLWRYTHLVLISVPPLKLGDWSLSLSFLTWEMSPGGPVGAERAVSGPGHGPYLIFHLLPFPPAAPPTLDGKLGQRDGGSGQGTGTQVWSVTSGVPLF